MGSPPPHLPLHPAGLSWGWGQGGQQQGLGDPGDAGSSGVGGSHVFMGVMQGAVGWGDHEVPTGYREQWVGVPIGVGALTT